MPLPLVAGLAALVPIVVTAMRVMLLAKAGAFVAKCIMFFGFTWATNKFAIQPAFDELRNHMQATPSGEYGALMVQWLGVLRFDQAVTMVISAYIAAWTIKGARVWLAKQPA